MSVMNDMCDEVDTLKLRIKKLEAELAECRRVAEGVKYRKSLRGFFVPQDTYDLLAAIGEIK